MLRIQEYTISDLRQALCPGGWFQAEPAPITKHRALAHVNNPRAAASDVALLVAYDDAMVVAHLGILPDKIFTDRGEQQIGWLTAWWANPDRKYAGLGVMLLMRAFSLYKGSLGASGFSEEARKVYDATKRFALIKDLQGVSVFARFNLYRQTRNRLPALAKFRTALRPVDAVLNSLISIRQSLWRKSHELPASGRIEYFSEVDNEVEEFIQRHSSDGLSRRGARELNWILRYPWVICAPLATQSSFLFSSVAESRSICGIKLYATSGQLAAVLIVTVVDDHVCVPYCFHTGQANLVMQFLLHFLLAQRGERLTIFQPALVQALSGMRFPWLYSINKRRTWIFSKNCAENNSRTFAIQDGDGDCVFTT